MYPINLNRLRVKETFYVSLTQRNSKDYKFICSKCAKMVEDIKEHNFCDSLLENCILLEYDYCEEEQETYKLKDVFLDLIFVSNTETNKNFLGKVQASSYEELNKVLKAEFNFHIDQVSVYFWCLRALEFFNVRYVKYEKTSNINLWSSNENILITENNKHLYLRMFEHKLDLINEQNIIELNKSMILKEFRNDLEKSLK